MEESMTVVVVAESSAPASSQDDHPRTERELRVARFARAILLALGIAVLTASIAGAGIGGEGAQGDRLGGDFPAFYGAGGIVWSGDIDALYDPVRQRSEQTEFGLDGYLAFAYPPHVAAAYAPLSTLDFQVAYAVHTLFMAGAFVGALFVLSTPVPLIARWRWPLLAAGFTFYPLFTAVGGGQNAALTMFMLALAWRGLHDDRPALVGIAAGLLLYRPQYAIPLMGLLLLSRQGRALTWAVVVGALTWAGTAAVLGVSWVSTWFDEVVPFVERDAEVNASNSISILGFLQASWGADARPAIVIGALGAALVIIAMMWLWANPERFSIADRMGALAIGVLLISPHTMFYDASLLLIAGVAMLHRAGQGFGHFDHATSFKVAGLVWVGSLLHVLGDGIGATPLALVVFSCFVAFFYQVSNHSVRSDLELSDA